MGGVVMAQDGSEKQVSDVGGDLSVVIGPGLLLAGIVGLVLAWRRGALSLPKPEVVHAAEDDDGANAPQNPVLGSLAVAGVMLLSRMLMLGALGGLVPEIQSENPPAWARPVVGLAALSVSIAVGVIGLAVVTSKSRQRRAEGTIAGDVRIGALGFLVMFPLAAGVGWLVTVGISVFGGEVPAAGHELLERMSEGAGRWIVMELAMAVLLAPVAEELLYRRCLQHGLGELMGAESAAGRWVPIVIATGIFTVMHGSVAPPSGLAAITVVGLGCGIAMERTGRVLVPIVLHMLFNLANVLMALVLL